jgi:hypothetical protein
MTSNMSNTDRIIRVIVALVIFVLFGMGTISGTLGYILVAVGAVFVLTSVINFCPLYKVFGISTK